MEVGMAPTGGLRNSRVPCDLPWYTQVWFERVVGHSAPPLCTIPSSSSMPRGGGGVPSQKPLHVFSCHLHPTTPFPFQRCMNRLSQTLYPYLVLIGFLHCRESIVKEYPCILQDPQVVAHHPFFRIWHGPPQIGKYIVYPRPLLKPMQLEWEVLIPCKVLM